ncbi:hypothetical protein VSH64_42290 [Amycolatopsis rhabdoformis]|uniref:Uncharacterized protein n=1 Tax=Amycolatopsis rhabdoformis TaxID=1448059 RepID=A0ABZ1I4N6_9PSEU|nr:hypothetical protein [Amycolatopsis rhabdoformis]WSE29368.1 hypothetical protein VSH64_42290 [Amycolatopsis rhabdoformis]
MSPAISWVSALFTALLIMNLASALDFTKLRKAVKRMKKIIVKKCAALVPAAVKICVLHVLMAASS